LRAFSRDAEHQPTEEARSLSRQAAAREPALPLTAKTLAKRLEAAVAAGDKNQVEAEHRALVRWLDRSAARGALHRNTAARRKAQAARLVSAPKR